MQEKVHQMGDRFEVSSGTGRMLNLNTAAARRLVITSLLLAILAIAAAFSQQTTGAPGSPSATTSTIRSSGNRSQDSLVWS
jgi:hypothetical protein